MTQNQPRPRTWQRIKKWYKGVYVPPDNDPDDVVIFLMGHYDRPVLARVIDQCVAFSRLHWKWLIGTAIALIGLLVVIF